MGCCSSKPGKEPESLSSSSHTPSSVPANPSPGSNPANLPPKQPISPTLTISALFEKHAQGRDHLSAEDGNISNFFSEIGFSLDKSDGFAAFCVLQLSDFSQMKREELMSFCEKYAVKDSAGLTATIKGKIAGLYGSSKALKGLYEYLFNNSKKIDTGFKSLSRDLAIPMLSSTF